MANPNMPLVSVIIPAYNQGHMLAAAIDSALAQSYSRVEVIVVNDGSTDPSTAETAARYTGRIRYIEQENKGVASARNTGIMAATGELVAFLDQDDVWLSHKLEVQVHALQRHPRVGLVHSSYYYIDRAGRRTGLVRLREGEWKPLPSLLFEVPISACTTLFPRRLLDEVGGLDPALAGSDDWDLWLRVAARGYRFYCIAEPLAEYRVHEAATSRDIDLMVRVGLGVVDKFFTTPGLSVELLRWRGRAYFHRHAPAAALYYGTGRIDRALEHLQAAARHYPQGLASGRLLQSFIYARSAQPTPELAQQAVRFVLSAAASSHPPLPPNIMRRLRAYAHLILALHRMQVQGRGRRMQLAGEVARTILAYPDLLADPQLWAAGWRRLKLRG